MALHPQTAAFLAGYNASAPVIDYDIWSRAGSMAVCRVGTMKASSMPMSATWRRCGGPGSRSGQGLGHGHHLHPHLRGLRLPCGRHRPLFPSCDRLGNAEPPNHRCRSTSSAHGGVEAQTEGQGADPFGSGRAVHQHGLGFIPQAPQSGSLDEPTRQLP